VLTPLTPKPWRLPPGRWTTVPVDSSVGFSLEYRAATLVATFKRFEVYLDADHERGAVLTGTVAADSLELRAPEVTSLVVSPRALRAAHQPPLHFASTAIVRSGEHVELDALLTIKGRTLPVAAVGTLDDAASPDRLRLALSTRVDRRQFGLDWEGSFRHRDLRLGTEIRLSADLDLLWSRPRPHSTAAHPRD
jgi:polyisoprenoid-binding protein YceI